MSRHLLAITVAAAVSLVFYAWALVDALLEARP